MNYYDEIKKRINNDNSSLELALSGLISVISKKSILSPDIINSESKILDDLALHLKIKNKKIPNELTELHDKLDYQLRSAGVMKRRVELTGEWWKETTGIILGSTIGGKALIIEPSFPLGYKFYDQNLKKNIKVNSETVKLLNDEGFCFYKPLPQKSLTLTDLLVFAIKDMKRFDILMILAISLLISVLGMLTPFINKQIFHSIIPSSNKGDVIPVTIFLLGAAIGTALFSITRNLVLMRIRDQINNSILNSLMLRIFSLPTAFFKNYSSGELSSRLLGVNKLCKLLSTSVISIGLSVIFSSIYIFQMFAFAPSLIMPSLFSLAFILIFTLITAAIQEIVYSKKSEISAKLNGVLFSLISGIQKIKLAGAEKRAFKKWAELYTKEAKLTFSPPLLLKLNKAISQILILLGLIIIYYFAAKNHVSMSNYIAFSISYGIVSNSILSLANIITSLADVKAILKMIKPILEAIPEVNDNKKQVTDLNGKIEISNVSFSYNKNGENILDDLSLSINPGEYIAIVGTSGSGKSTLMRLLLGFEKPDTGAVYYDGMDINTLDAISVRQRIGTCLQNGKLFVGDIFSNISITSPLSKMEDAWHAAQLSGIADDIKEMPMQMHTIISEGSGGISGGQKQRLLIARALIGKPNILFFDEATSALDNITQKVVSDSLDSLGCTRVIIAHRLSTVINCDRIVVLDKGKIIESGNYKELIKKQGIFYKLAKRQIT